MGVTGVNGFPCCSKKSVEVVETQKLLKGKGSDGDQFHSLSFYDEDGCTESTSAFTSGAIFQNPTGFSYKEELKIGLLGAYNALSQQGSHIRATEEEELEEEIMEEELDEELDEEEDVEEEEEEEEEEVVEEEEEEEDEEEEEEEDEEEELEEVLEEVLEEEGGNKEESGRATNKSLVVPVTVAHWGTKAGEDFQEDSDPQPEPVEDETELLDDTLDLEAEQDLDSESELESELEPDPRLLPESESELEEEDPVPVNVFVQASNLAFNLAPKNVPPGPRVNVQIQTAVGPKGTLELSISHEPRTAEPAPVRDGGNHTFRSVFVQTSKHLFRVDKVMQAADAKQPSEAGRRPFPVRDWPFQKPRRTASKESLLSGSKMLMEDIRVQTSHPSLGIEGFPPRTPVQALLPEKVPAEAQSLSSPNFSAKFSEPLDFRMFDSRPTSASLPPALVSSTTTSGNSSCTELAVEAQALVSCPSPSALRAGSRSPLTQGSTTDLSVATEQRASPAPSLKPPEAGEPQKPAGQEFALKPGFAVSVTKPPSERAAMEGEGNRLQPPSLSPMPAAPWKEWSPTDDQEIHSDTEMVQLDPRCLEPEVGEDPEDLTPKMKKESLASWITQQARGRPATETKPQSIDSPIANRRRDLSSLFAPVDIPAEYEHPLTSRQVAAFQDVFQLFKPGSQGKLDMRSMKGALRTLGIQLSPQEVCEALRRADLDGDGAVDFEDFLGILTDNHRFAQCMGRMRNSRINDPHGLETLFFEMMSKFVGQGALSPNYYTDKQRVLRMSSWWKGLNHKHNRSYQSRSHTGLSFFCQATRLTGLNNRQLARSLHNLRDLNVQGPYSQVPNLPPRTRSTERRIRSRGPRLTNLARPCKPKPPPREAPRRVPEPIPQRPKSEEGTAELGPAPSPPTLVQSQLPSPPPATPQSHSLPNVYQ